MLWFDDSPKPLGEKIREAAAYYLKKYGVPASACYINPEALPATSILPIVWGIIVARKHNVLPNHLWIGTG